LVRLATDKSKPPVAPIRNGRAIPHTGSRRDDHDHRRSCARNHRWRRIPIETSMLPPPLIRWVGCWERRPFPLMLSATRRCWADSRPLGRDQDRPRGHRFVRIRTGWLPPSLRRRGQRTRPPRAVARLAAPNRGTEGRRNLLRSGHIGMLWPGERSWAVSDPG
jgi:hypothetical protein